MTEDAERQFILEGLSTYGDALGAVREFESVLGSLCARVVESAAQEADEFRVGETTQTQQRWCWQPWIAAWAPMNTELVAWQLWASVWWNWEGEISGAWLKASCAGAPADLTDWAASRMPSWVDVSKKGASWRFMRPVSEADLLEEHFQELANTVVRLHLEAIQAAQGRLGE